MGVLDFEGGEREGGERESRMETVRNGDEQRERDSSPRVRDERVAGQGGVAGQSLRVCAVRA